MTTALLELRDVARSYRRRDAGVDAVAGVSLTMSAGEIVSLVGASGAGKSTLSRLILGLERPDRGAVLLAGVDLATLRGRALRRARQQMHLILQDPYDALHPGMRIAEAVGEPLAVAGVPPSRRTPRVAAALEDAGLRPANQFERRFPHQLSGGQRQRVAIARAIVGRPAILLADEPTGNLDSHTGQLILDMLSALNRSRGVTVLMVTHNLFAAMYGERTLEMQDGRIIRDVRVPERSTPLTLVRDR